MKTTILISIIILTLLLFMSCDNNNYNPYPHYSYGKQSYLPDSNKQKVADFIIKSTSAASLHMSTADYEDPEDLIEQADRTGTKLYSVLGEGLYKRNCNECSINFLYKNELTEYQLKLFDSLKIYQK